MALSKILISVLALATTPVMGAESKKRTGYGLIGFGIKMYDPVCAYTCSRSVPKMLDCPDNEQHEGMDMSSMDMMEMMAPSPECLASNEPYLTSLAWCISTHCPRVDVWELERWWINNVAGKLVGQPKPKISYQEALAQIEEPPTNVIGEHDMLNRTVLIDEEGWLGSLNGNAHFEKMEGRNSGYAIIIFVTCAIMPIFLSLFRFLPFPASWFSTFNAYLIDPPAFGSHHALPVFGLALVPTRGQALFIVYIITINVILSSVAITVLTPNSWFADVPYQVYVLLSNRVGHLSFCNLPLLILFAGRNNILLWLTNWTHSTFLLVHRWIAVICTLQACLHAAIYLALYVNDGIHAEEAAKPYWYWGIIATWALVLMLPLSMLPIRRIAYEAFLISHIVLGVVALVGCWYHVIELYSHQWGYELWLYMSFTIWAFDRLLRVMRLARGGVKRAFVSRVDEDYLRIDIPDADCQGHVFVYFPTLTWKIWENHPFSVVAFDGETDVPATQILAQPNKLEHESSSPDRFDSQDHLPHIVRQRRGISLLVRTHGGLTSLFSSSINSSSGIPVLIESSYTTTGATFMQEDGYIPTAAYPNRLVIAGGVGITGVLPILERTSHLFASLGTTKLYWGVRSRALVSTVESMVVESSWNNMEKHISVGQRINVREVLEKELGSVGTTVLVCGPPGMADEVRCAVAAMGRHGAVIRLVEESFSW